MKDNLRTSQPAYVESLDGLRAVAVLAVLLYHAGFPGASLGWLGVDLFFVLSGFLITTILANEYHSRGRISVVKFWGRRVFRLIPAYWLYLGALTVFLIHSGVEIVDAHGWTPTTYMASLWLYFNNYVPPGGLWEHQQVFTAHLWSLAVEEQFYLVWPILCWVSLSTKRPYLLAFGLLLIIAAFRFYSESTFELRRMIYTRGDGIVFGCAAALLLYCHQHSVWAKQLAISVYRYSVVAFTVTLVVVLTGMDSIGLIEMFEIHRYFQPILVFLFSVIVMMLWRCSDDGLGKVLSTQKILVYIGKISYGVYLYHMVAHFLTWDVLLVNVEHWPKLVKYSLRLLVFLSLTLIIATLSYYLVERPFLKRKKHLH